MEAGRKRKAANAPETPSADGASALKKIKLLNTNHASAAKSKVQELGQKLMSALRVAQDKNKGHLIAEQFLTLPSRHELPDYYEVTKLPVAFDTIEEKLRRNAYPTMTTLESDLKRLVHNAKEYNAPKSDIYEDAERIRKLVFNYMKQNNPQYSQDPNYTSFPTPIPHTNGGAVQNGTMKEEEDEDVDELQSDPVARDSEQPRNSAGTAVKVSEPRSDRKQSLAPSATTGAEDGGGGGEALVLDGLSFQDAQQRIVSYLLHYTDEQGLEIYSPFVNLPSRKLEDYYQVIRHPLSLKGLAKRCRGEHGRAPPSGVSDFKTWDAFEEEVSFIWRNAQEYNDDASDMYTLANEFKDHFKSLLVEAREKVDEPAGPRIKLGGPKPKVTLNLSQHRNSPVPAGVHVDNEALARQRLMVAAGVNGNNSRPPPLSNGVARSTELRPSSSGLAGSPPGAALKTERYPGQSPALQHSVPHSQTNSMMHPPAMRPPSGSPHPSQQPPVNSSYTYTVPGLLPPIATRAYPLEQALLPTVSLATHPQLPIPNRFHIAIPPHATLAQQSTTITLPNSHYFLQICPSISKELSTGRPYKLFVTLNGVRLNQRDTKFFAETGRRTHVYEGSLMQGVNRMEVEVAASKVVDEGGKGEGLDVEKVTVYANLLKA
ncbi:hypothetical protein LTR59_006328 [Friedmanniomyces endolithicus]|nr:hypothetical protein LTR94_009548 [Friedmanniomyces endolithicus]KAK0795964.1 hypothetical protein LTR38_008684 [Friedmanniomyces endolithicus]KAK0798794.1 hypothetical protein LTR59_006328 [Friedmanniomyces endolithicus]